MQMQTYTQKHGVKSLNSQLKRTAAHQTHSAPSWDNLRLLMNLAWAAARNVHVRNEIQSDMTDLLYVVNLVRSCLQCFCKVCM